jgi:hypothetical protein
MDEDIHSPISDPYKEDDITVSNIQNDQQQPSTQNTSFSNNSVLVEIDNLLASANTSNEECKKLIANKQFAEAELKYTEVINDFHKYKPDASFNLENQENKKKGKEILEMLVTLYSNLALAQAKQGKDNEVMYNSMIILNNFNMYHDKSYIRIMKCLINRNEIIKAKGMMDEIKIKFPEKEKIKVFEEVFDLLEFRLKQIEEMDKNLKNKKKTENCIVNNFPCLLTKIVIGVGVGILGGVFLKKYFFTK